jgi:5-formyltetrahydrofolate cyclo-ligase
MKDKELLREKIWNHLTINKLTAGGICTGRIPKFKGAMKAAVMLKNTPEWAESQIIFCSPDSAQMKVREYALRDGKDLIMASPKLKSGYLKISPEDACHRESEASTIKGAFKIAQKIKNFPQLTWWLKDLSR